MSTRSRLPKIILTISIDICIRMPWAGDSNVLIDRFDGRALLDFLPTDAASVVDSGLRPDRDEDGIGNELRFERWHDLADKIRLHSKTLV